MRNENIKKLEWNKIRDSLYHFLLLLLYIYTQIGDGVRNSTSDPHHIVIIHHFSDIILIKLNNQQASLNFGITVVIKLINKQI